MLERTRLINELIKKNGYKSYLEIGYGAGINFKDVKCKSKISVDPFQEGATKMMTSDEFFKKNKKKFDIVFVDGMHLAENVLRDVSNALKFLLPGGVILIHDCLPGKEERASRERITRNWQGDVWKGVVELAVIGWKMELLDIETGIVLLYPEEKTYDIPGGQWTWEWYQENFKKMLCE